ncbi:MAG TPA: carbohydrate binding domain-containing protein, partial [Rariglobus sp.]|nr:carbohydrate binding domain-containing protein [Rariglobus sp.]
MKTKTHPPLRRALVALTLSALFCSVPARAINAIVNDNFISGTDPWSLKLAAGTAASLDNNAGWGRVLITNGGSSKSSVAFEQPLAQPLIAGVTYTIAFDARADATKSIDVLLRSTSPAATIYSSNYGISVGTSSARTTITYTHSGSDVSDAKISFRIGGNTTTLYIDNVVVTRQGSPSQLLSKVGGVWQFNTLSVGGKSWNAGAYDFSYAGYNYGEREEFTGIPGSTQTISAVANEDITDKINTALAALPSGGTVIIPAGTFRIGAGKTGKAISVTTDNTVIKGAGMGVTTLKVDATYHVATAVADRQEATFASGVINFYKGNSGGWFYGSIQANSATVSATAPLGTRTLTISDPSNKLDTATGIVIRQIMWSSFVSTYANNSSYAPKPLRWTDYDAANVPLFSDPSYSFCYYRRILSRSGNVLTLDVPIPHELNPVNAMITVTSSAPSNFLNNSGLQDLTLTADAEDGVANP